MKKWVFLVRPLHVYRWSSPMRPANLRRRVMTPAVTDELIDLARAEIPVDTIVSSGRNESVERVGRRRRRFQRHLTMTLTVSQCRRRRCRFYRCKRQFRASGDANGDRAQTVTNKCLNILPGFRNDCRCRRHASRSSCSNRCRGRRRCRSVDSFTIVVDAAATAAVACIGKSVTFALIVLYAFRFFRISFRQIHFSGKSRPWNQQSSAIRIGPAPRCLFDFVQND